MSRSSRVREAQVVTLGETLALIHSHGEQRLQHATTVALSTGGAESNVAVALSRLGVPTAWFGRVGADGLGDRVLRDLRGEDVAVHAVVDPSWPTALMVKEQVGLGRTRVTYHRRDSAGAHLHPDDLDDDVLRAARILHLTGITPGLSESAAAAVEHALGIAAEVGATVSLDLNHRAAVWHDADYGGAMRALLQRVDVAFGSPHEIGLVVDGAPTADPAELAARLAALGPRTAVVKLGADGACVLVEGRTLSRPAVPVDVVDTVGAGDAFVAGWLAALLDDPTDVDAMLRNGLACGAWACTVPGDWEGAPRRRDLLASTDISDAVMR